MVDFTGKSEMGFDTAHKPQDGPTTEAVVQEAQLRLNIALDRLSMREAELQEAVYGRHQAEARIRQLEAELLRRMASEEQDDSVA